MRFPSRRASPLALLFALLPLAAQLLAAPSPALADPPGLSGPDVASYQHPNGASADWGAARAEGRTFAFVKATEGTGYLNPYFSSDWQATAAAGLFHGAYHYARPNGAGGSAQAQAQAFANAIGPQTVPGTLPPVLDLEESGGLAPAALQTWTKTFLDAVQQATGRVPMIYTYPNFWYNQMAASSAFTNYPLWIASYGTSSAPTLGWPRYTFWQYTSSGSVAGIATAGSTDISTFWGSSLDLAALALAGTWTPPTSTAADTTSSGGPGAASSGTPGTRYQPLDPVRLVDTRSGLGGRTGPGLGTLTVQLPAAVPAGATSVVLDVSAVVPKGAGYLRTSATGSPPTTTALNYPLGRSATGLVVSPIGPNSQVDVSTYGGATDLVVDAVGYYTSAAGTGGFWTPLPAQRLVDTRFGLGAPKGPAIGSLDVTLPGGVPADATGVVLDVSSVDAHGDGYLRLGASGGAAATALNYEGGTSTTGLALTRTAAGKVTVTLAGDPSDVVVDLVGYYEGRAATGSGYVPLTPQRVVDTRGRLGAGGPGTGPLALTLPSSVPPDATAAVLDVSLVEPDGRGYLRLAAPGAEPTTTALNAVGGRSRTGLVVTAVVNRQLVLGLYGPNSHLVVDLVGYQTAVPAAQASPSPSPSGVTASPVVSPTASPGTATAPSPRATATASGSPAPSPRASLAAPRATAPGAAAPGAATR